MKEIRLRKKFQRIDVSLKRFFRKTMIQTCRGDNQNGHLPPKCSVNMAIHRSTLPKIARWMITGRCLAPVSLNSWAKMMKHQYELIYLLSIRQIESFRQIEVQLNRSALVLSTKCVLNFDVNLWTVKCAVAFVQRPRVAESVECRLQLRLGVIPEFCGEFLNKKIAKN